MSEAVSGVSENGGSAASPGVGKDHETAGGPASASPSPTASSPCASSPTGAEGTAAAPPSEGSSAAATVEQTTVPLHEAPSGVSTSAPMSSSSAEESVEVGEADVDHEADGENVKEEGGGDSSGADVEQGEEGGSESADDGDAPAPGFQDYGAPSVVDTAVSAETGDGGAARSELPSTSDSSASSGPADASPPTEAAESTGNGSSSSTTDGAPAATPLATDLPCMRAELVVSPDGAHVMAGLWGMNPAAHDNPGHTSPFELKLAPPRPGLPPHPPRASGLYTGFFMLQQPAPKPALKVDEKSVHLTFIANADGGHNVQGTGKNRFGQFQVTGSVAASGRAELFRAYLPKPTAPTGGVPGRKRTNSAAASAPKRSTSALTIDASVVPPFAPGAGTSPGGSPRGLGGKTIQGLSTSTSSAALSSVADTFSPRSKRTTAGDWKDKADIPVNREPAGEPRAKAAAAAVAAASAHPERKGKGKEHAQTANSAGSSSPLAAGGGDEGLGLTAKLPGLGVELPSSLVGGSESKAGRVRKLPAHLQEAPRGKQVVRLNEHMRKCLSVLRDLQRHPSGTWFAVPVDWKAHNLVDYPSVVKRPMDFGTVKTLVESGAVATPDEFRDHVLLVFRNATVYNAKKDNMVHIAAVELRSLFEDKFRQHVESLGTPQLEDIKPVGGGGGGRGRKAGGGGGNRSGAAASSNRGRGGSTPRAGPPPGAVVSSGGVAMIPEAQYMQLQQQMEVMAAQLQELRRQTSQTEVSMAVQLQAQEAQRSIGGMLSFGAGAAACGGGGLSGGGCGGGGGGGCGGRGRVDDSRPLTEAEKEALKAGINKLPAERIHRVVEIIKERSPALGGDEDDEIEVDLDMLDAPTLHELQRYVKSCAPKKRKKPSSGSGPGAMGGVMHHPSPGLPDELDMDVNALEEDAMFFGESKRGRGDDMDDLGVFSQSDLPDEV